MAKISLKKLQSQEEIAKRNQRREEIREELKNGGSSKITAKFQGVIDEIESSISSKNNKTYYFAWVTTEEELERRCIIGDEPKGYKPGQLVQCTASQGDYGANYRISGLIE